MCGCTQNTSAYQKFALIAFWLPVPAGNFSAGTPDVLYFVNLELAGLQSRYYCSCSRRPGQHCRFEDLVAFSFLLRFLGFRAEMLPKEKGPSPAATTTPRASTVGELHLRQAILSPDKATLPRDCGPVCPWVQDLWGNALDITFCCNSYANCNSFCY